MITKLFKKTTNNSPQKDWTPVVNKHKWVCLPYFQDSFYIGNLEKIESMLSMSPKFPDPQGFRELETLVFPNMEDTLKKLKHMKHENPSYKVLHGQLRQHNSRLILLVEDSIEKYKTSNQQEKDALIRYLNRME